LSDVPAAFVVHRLPGRTRLHVPSRRGNEDYFSSAVLELAMARGIVAASANARLGSLLLHHDRPLEAIAAMARRRGLFLLAELEPAPASVIEEMRAEAAGWNEALRRVAADTDAVSLAFLALCVAALGQLGRGVVLPPAVTLAWYALNLVIATTEVEARRELARVPP
jgi:hypothetical protein